MTIPKVDLPPEAKAEMMRLSTYERSLLMALLTIQRQLSDIQDLLSGDVTMPDTPVPEGIYR